MLNGRQLQKLFHGYNALFFGGRLTPYSIRVVSHISKLNQQGKITRKRRLIRLTPGPDEVMVSYLVHEMAHAATTDNHGILWKREMIRLRDAGAPLVPPDDDIDLKETSERISMRAFRDATEDALRDTPDITLSQAIQSFIYHRGGPSTITKFRQKYPGVGAVFEKLKLKQVESVHLRKEKLRLFGRAG